MDPINSPRISWFPFRYVVMLAGGIASTLLPVRQAEAELIAYRNAGQFAAAISGRTTNLANFDDGQVGQVLTNSTYQGVVFGANPNIQGNLITTTGAPAITGGLKAFSGTSFLGSDAGDLITLGANQSFSFTFQSTVSAVGFYFLSNSQLGSGELGMRIGSGATAPTVVIDPLNGNEIPLTGAGVTDSFAYFVGIVDTNALGVLPSITVFPGSTTAGSFGIDNITSAVTAVPEPGSILIVAATAFLGLGTRAWRRHRRI